MKSVVKFLAGEPRCGEAIRNAVDLGTASPQSGIGMNNRKMTTDFHRCNLLTGEAPAATELAHAPTLNAVLAAGAAPRRALRHAVSALLASGSRAEAHAATLLPAAARAACLGQHLPHQPRS